MGKNLALLEKNFLLDLDDQEIEIFTMDFISDLFKHKYSNLQSIIYNLTNSGALIRLENKKYCKKTFVNDFALGTFILKDSAIAYWSALNYWGITEQIPNTVFVQSLKLKKNKRIRGVYYRFVKISEKKFTGMIQIGRGDHKFRITDLEKTIIDCFDLPAYSGGYDELIRSFIKTKLNTTKLLNYSLKVDNLSIMKRISFLADSFKLRGFERYKKETKERLKDKYTLFSPLHERKGNFNSEWKLLINVDLKKLKD
ncbi:MAG: hypothetical protein P9L97_10745 [Candidatus Tenebribacter davisii]|nr:hypothetical protein [Candidatus Tenebribacter davisii]